MVPPGQEMLCVFTGCEDRFSKRAHPPFPSGRAGTRGGLGATRLSTAGHTASRLCAEGVGRGLIVKERRRFTELMWPAQRAHARVIPSRTAIGGCDPAKWRPGKAIWSRAPRPWRLGRTTRPAGREGRVLIRFSLFPHSSVKATRRHDNQG